MRLTSKAGFSLIELMIVVAIIGILATVAVPSYLNYTKKARFSEVIAAAEPYKLSVALALQQGIPLAELKNTMHGIPPEPYPTKNLASLAVKEGKVVAKGTEMAGNATYILKPNTDGSVWTVGGTCVEAGLCEA